MKDDCCISYYYGNGTLIPWRKKYKIRDPELSSSGAEGARVFIHQHLRVRATPRGRVASCGLGNKSPQAQRSRAW